MNKELTNAILEVLFENKDFTCTPELAEDMAAAAMLVFKVSQKAVDFDPEA